MPCICYELEILQEKILGYTVHVHCVHVHVCTCMYCAYMYQQFY